MLQEVAAFPSPPARTAPHMAAAHIQPGTLPAMAAQRPPSGSKHLLLEPAAVSMVMV